MFNEPSEFVDYRPEAIKSGGASEIYDQERIVVRQIGSHPEGCICPPGLLTLNTIYNIYETTPDGHLKFYLAFINSSLTAFYWKLRFFDNKETFPKIKKAPLLAIPIPDATETQRTLIESLVTCVSFAAAFVTNDNPAEQSARDPLMLAYFEQILNALVYELYFPEEVHGAGLHLFDLVEQAKLPSFDILPEPDRIPHLRTLFESLYDGTHPLRIALTKLQTLDTVRIIEGTECKK